MPRKEIHTFSENDISRIFIARNVREAKFIERIFAQNKIDYSIELESYVSTRFFGSSNYIGATFYVRTEKSAFCKELLTSHGLHSGIIDEENSV
ncbi:MAG: hypothetical protein MRJ65_11255 [Candidatus Brocadiaceae bacterium]|nr:hypothetical protein [Candidatus Brocadiaceae bacterium]